MGQCGGPTLHYGAVCGAANVAREQGGGSARASLGMVMMEMWVTSACVCVCTLARTPCGNTLRRGPCWGALDERFRVCVCVCARPCRALAWFLTRAPRPCKGGARGRDRRPPLFCLPPFLLFSLLSPLLRASRSLVPSPIDLPPPLPRSPRLPFCQLPRRRGALRVGRLVAGPGAAWPGGVPPRCCAWRPSPLPSSRAGCLSLASPPRWALDSPPPRPAGPTPTRDL